MKERIKQLLEHPVVEECLFHGLELLVSERGIRVEGFYKSNTVNLVIGDGKQPLELRGKLLAIGRWGEVSVIDTFKSLVECNLYWWEITQSRNTSPISLNSPWKEFAIEFGLVEKHTVEFYKRKK